MRNVILYYSLAIRRRIVYYDKALAIDPNYVNALNNKAFTLSEMDRNEEALSIIKQPLASNPDNEYLLTTMAFILYKLGQYEQKQI